MILIIFQIFTTISISLAIFVCLKQYYERNIICKNIPGPPILPIIGNLMQITSDQSKLLSNMMQLMRDYGKIIQLWIGPAQMIMITDIKIAEKLLSSTKHIKKLNLINKCVRSWLGNGLSTNNDAESWHKRRKILTPAFHFTLLEESSKVFNSLIDPLIENLEKHLDGDAFNIYPYGAHYTLDVIYKAGMGIEMNTQTNSNSPYVLAVSKILDVITRRIYSVFGQINFIFNLSKDGQEQNRYLKIIHGMGYKTIAERRLLKLENANNESEQPKKHKAFLDTLLDCTIDGRPLTDEELREEVDTFTFGGYYTLSRVAGFLFYELANHPEVQTRLFDEIQEVLGKDKTKLITRSDLSKLKYLEAVIREILRLYPPVTMLPRQLKEDLEVDGITIPKGRGIAIFIYGIHHDEDNFFDAESFKPERFLEKQTDRSPFSYIPFSAGPRNCIGQKYALCELKFLAVKILQNFILLSGGPKHTLKIRIAGVLTAENGIFVKVKRRVYN